MLVNAPYIDIDYNLPNVSNIVVESRFIEKGFCQNEKTADISFFNSYLQIKKQNTFDEIHCQSDNVSYLTEEYEKINQYIKQYPNVFANVHRETVLKNYFDVLNSIISNNPEVIHTDISKEDECLFIYFQKGELKIFFNMFYDDEAEALINISAQQHKYTIEDSIGNGIQKMSKIICELEAKTSISRTSAA